MDEESSQSKLSNSSSTVDRVSNDGYVHSLGYLMRFHFILLERNNRYSAKVRLFREMFAWKTSTEPSQNYGIPDSVSYEMPVIHSLLYCSFKWTLFQLDNLKSLQVLEFRCHNTFGFSNLLIILVWWYLFLNFTPFWKPHMPVKELLFTWVTSWFS